MDEQKLEQKAQEELITIAGGVELEVAYQNNGHKEMVKVRQIPISKIQNFVFALANEAEAIELYCDKPKGWADTLSVESASAIADKGQELNLPFFAAWFRRQIRWRESQQPGAMTTGTRNAGETQAKSSSPSVSGSSAPPSPITTT
jgi:hypothetical protein